MSCHGGTHRNLQTQTHIAVLVQEAAAKDQAALAQGAKETLALQASMLSLNTELAKLKQKLQRQQSELEVASDLKSQLERRLEADTGSARAVEAANAQQILVSSGPGVLLSIQ